MYYDESDYYDEFDDHYENYWYPTREDYEYELERKIVYDDTNDCFWEIIDFNFKESDYRWFNKLIWEKETYEF